MYVCHREEGLPALTPRTTGPTLTDVPLVPDLPYQVLQVVEIHNLPFRALRQYASLDRSA